MMIDGDIQHNISLTGETVKMLVETVFGEGNIVLRRKAAELVIVASTTGLPALNEHIAIGILKIIDGVIPMPFDYELQALIVQIIYNLKKMTSISKALASFEDWSAFAEIKSSSFESDCRKFLMNYNDLKSDLPKSIKVIEVIHCLKLYCQESRGYFWLDLNEQSMTCQVTNPINGEPLLIEVTYDLIINWTIEKRAIANIVTAKLELSNDSKIAFGLYDLHGLKLLTEMFATKKIAQKRKISVVNPAPNHFESEQVDSFAIEELNEEANQHYLTSSPRSYRPTSPIRSSWPSCTVKRKLNKAKYPDSFWTTIVGISIKKENQIMKKTIKEWKYCFRQEAKKAALIFSKNLFPAFVNTKGKVMHDPPVAISDSFQAIREPKFPDIQKSMPSITYEEFERYLY